MRIVALVVSLVACAPIDPIDEVEGTGPLPIDTQGVWGPEPSDTAALRVLQLRPDLESVALSFNQTGVVVATDIPFPAVTPFLPRPVDEVSLQLWAEAEVVHTSDASNFGGPFGEIIAWGSDQDQRTLHLDIDPTPDPGRAQVRLVNVSPNLFYAGFAPIADPPGAPLISAFEGDVSDVVSIPASAVQRWILDVNGDGRGDVPYQSFELPAEDGAGNGQYAEIFLVPSGSVLPGTNIPVPFLLVVPMSGADETFAVFPATG